MRSNDRFDNWKQFDGFTIDRKIVFNFHIFYSLLTELKISQIPTAPRNGCSAKSRPRDPFRQGGVPATLWRIAVLNKKSLIWAL